MRLLGRIIPLKAEGLIPRSPACRSGRSAAEYVSPEFSGLWVFIPVILYPLEEIIDSKLLSGKGSVNSTLVLVNGNYKGIIWVRVGINTSSLTGLFLLFSWNYVCAL